MDSYEYALRMYHERVSLGLQPSVSVVNGFDKHVQDLTLVSANLLYLLITPLLYFYMSRQEVRPLHDNDFEGKSESMEN